MLRTSWEQLLTIQEVADSLKISVPTVRRLFLSGQLPPPIRVGKSLRWKPSSLTEFFDFDETEEHPAAYFSELFAEED